ncbi:uncharacterized protein LOC129590062 isoform X2 [Paramacrobiotus metropolitanus]|uniref:uncharacterized protein LOC129590062 isoform X2 n=1 Tax=Paramacrobiotus metropolitanus TaxID=2943436 RepID=UPI002445FD9A|nr:uncharacterized protein LOC129590062 isoform X2 [Paramacrobiotus metropolitanus]
MKSMDTSQDANVDYKQLLEQQIKTNAELTSALERLTLGGRLQFIPPARFIKPEPKPPTPAVLPPRPPAATAEPVAVETPKDIELHRVRSCPVNLDHARSALALHGNQSQKQRQLDNYCETYLHRIGRAADGQTMFSVGVIAQPCAADRFGVISAKLPNGDIGEYTYNESDLMGKPYAAPNIGDLVYFVYPNRGPKDVRTAAFVMPMKLQSASWYRAPNHRERGIVLRVMRHQGGVYIGTAYNNVVMFAPFRAVVHPCQYTRRGDHVEFNIPPNYVPPKDTNAFSFTEGLINVCVVPAGSLWEGSLSEEKIVGYVSRVPSQQNNNTGLIQFMDEKKINPDQTLKMSYIAFNPKDVNYDHSSLVKMNHKVSFRILACGEKRAPIAVNIGIEEGLEKFRGHIVAVCNGYGFIEHEHLTDIWFHFTRLRPGVDGRKLRIGCLVEYSLLPQKPDRSGLQACQVQPLLHQYLPGYQRLEDDAWHVGVVERALRNTNPAQSQYHGLIRTRINDQEEVYLFSMSGIVRKYEALQVGDRVKFQVGLDGQTTLRRAVNIIRTAYVLQVKTLRADGEFGFLYFGGQDLFFHSSQIRNRMRPHQGDWVECALAKDRHGRLCASSVRILHPREMTRENYEKAMTLNPRVEGDFPRPHIQPRNGGMSDKDYSNMEDFDLDHGYGSGQPRSHNVPREPYWLVVVPDMFRDSCKAKASQIKVPKHLHDAWLNGMSTTINFKPPDVPASVATNSTSKYNGELGDFERTKASEISIQDLVKAQQEFKQMRSSTGEKGDSNELPSILRGAITTPRTSNWLVESSNTVRALQPDPRNFVRATKSHEFHMGRGRALSRY